VSTLAVLLALSACTTDFSRYRILTCPADPKCADGGSTMGNINGSKMSTSDSGSLRNMDSSTPSMDSGPRYMDSGNMPDGGTRNANDGSRADASMALSFDAKAASATDSGIDAGSGCAASSAKVQIIVPTSLTANSEDQMVSVTGTGLRQGGSIFIHAEDPSSADGGANSTVSNDPIVTSWVSDTEATAIVPAARLMAPGSVSVGYVCSNSQGTCSSAAPNDCDWSSNGGFLTIPIQ
jgi:hypothetical protein